MVLNVPLSLLGVGPKVLRWDSCKKPKNCLNKNMNTSFKDLFCEGAKEQSKIVDDLLYLGYDTEYTEGVSLTTSLDSLINVSITSREWSMMTEQKFQ